jgi:hypothetical protein
MHQRLALFCVIILAGVAVAASAGETATKAAADTIASSDDCCFNNPRYTGVCRVTPGADETCADILAYLNNQSSTGKTYCGNTKVRGGWSQIECDSGDQRCTGTGAPETTHDRL